MPTPKVFMSYSWTSQEHTDWVVTLAERLMADAIEVVLDRWDLKEGHDKYAFMEKMVTDPSVTKVLMICDAGYKAKADGRAGGVGTESQIISAEIYGKVAQEKFIPVVVEYEDGVACLPVFLKTAMYIDLSHSESELNDYEKLVRSICDKPLYKKPALGATPSFLLDDSKPQVKTTHKFNEFKNAVMLQRPHANGAERQYLALFLDALPEFRVTDTTDKFDDAIAKSIVDLKVYRDQFLEFIELKCVYGGDQVSFDKVFEFFEDLGSFFGPPAGVSSYNPYWSDNYKFFAWELFLYLIALLKKNGRLSDASMFLEEAYHVKGNDRSQPQVVPYQTFDQYLPSLDEHRNSRLQIRKASLTASMLRDHADNALVSFEELMEVDFILCLRHIIHQAEGAQNWFPRTLIYVSQHSHHPFRLFTKAVSARHQAPLCSLLGVKSLKELISLYEKAAANNAFEGYRFSRAFGGIPFKGLMNFAELEKAVG